jgi:hypothetical protein
MQMSIGDFINDPFGTAGKAMADLAPDGVRETVHDAQSTLHDMAESATNPTMPDAGAMTQTYADGHTETTLADGTFVEKHADHTDTMSPDGARMTSFSDGSSSTTNPDGSSVYIAGSGPHTDMFDSDNMGAAGPAGDSSGSLGQYVSEHGIAPPDLGNYSLGEATMPETHTLGENTNPNPISVDIGPAQIEEPSPVVVDIGPAQIEPEQTVGEQAQNAGIDSSSGAADFGGMAAEGPATPSYDPGPYGGLGAEGPADGSGQGGDFGGLGAAGPVGGSDEGYDIF